MNTTKKIVLAMLLVFVLSVVMAVAMAAPEDKNETTDAPKAAKATTAGNNSFVICMKSAVDAKQTSYSAAKDAKKVCLDAATASNETGAKKAAGKNCNADFKKSMKDAKNVFRADRNECKKIKHTAFEGFKANFQ